MQKILIAGLLTHGALAAWPDTPKDGGEFRIICKQSGKGLDVELGGISSNGTKVQQWDAVGGENQVFRLQSAGAGDYRIICKQSGKGLDVDLGGIAANGTKVQQWDAVGGDNQLFRFQDAGNDYYRIICKQSGKGLDVDLGGIAANGTKVQQWDPVGGDNQLFRLQSVGSHTDGNTNAGAGKVTGGKRTTFGPQRGAKGGATFYRNGVITIEGEAWTDKLLVATRASVFAILVDGRGRALYITPNFEFPTAYAKGDPTGPSTVTKTFTAAVPAEIGPLINSVDLYFTERDNNYWRTRVRSINDSVQSYNDLDPKVKAAISAALGAL